MKKNPKVGSKFMRIPDAKIFVCIEVVDSFIPIYVLKDEKKGTMYHVCWEHDDTWSHFDIHCKKTFFELMEV